MTWSWFPAVIWIFTYQLITVSGSHQEYLRLTNARVSLFCGATTTHTRIQRTRVLVLVQTYSHWSIHTRGKKFLHLYWVKCVIIHYWLCCDNINCSAARWGEEIFCFYLYLFPVRTIQLVLSSQLTASGSLSSIQLSLTSSLPPSLRCLIMRKRGSQTGRIVSLILSVLPDRKGQKCCSSSSPPSYPPSGPRAWLVPPESPIPTLSTSSEPAGATPR